MTGWIRQSLSVIQPTKHSVDTPASCDFPGRTKVHRPHDDVGLEIDSALPVGFEYQATFFEYPLAEDRALSFEEQEVHRVRRRDNLEAIDEIADPSAGNLA